MAWIFHRPSVPSVKTVENDAKKAINKGVQTLKRDTRTGINDARNAFNQGAQIAGRDFQTIVRDAGKFAGNLANKLDVERQMKIDAFLEPLLHSRLGHTEAYTRSKALLEYQARQGKDPQDFVREMVQKSKQVFRQHHHQYSVAKTYLQALRSGNNIQRFRAEVFQPVNVGSISLTEAWRRVNNLVASSSPSMTADAASPLGGSSSQKPPLAPNKTSYAPALDALSWLNQQFSGNAVGTQTHSSPAMAAGPLLVSGWTLAIGIAPNVSAGVGLAGNFALLGYLDLSPAIYWGGEVSVGAQAGAEIDLVVEVGFCQPANFGGWYWSFGIGAAAGPGLVAGVCWALPQPPTNPVDVWTQLNPIGFSIGAGLGADFELCVGIGGGQVVFLPNRSNSAAGAILPGFNS